MALKWFMIFVCFGFSMRTAWLYVQYKRLGWDEVWLKNLSFLSLISCAIVYSTLNTKVF